MKSRFAWLLSYLRRKVSFPTIAAFVAGGAVFFAYEKIARDEVPALHARTPAPRPKAAPKKAAKRVVALRSVPAPDPLTGAGHLLYKAGSFSSAEDSYKKALRENEQNGEARFWLAMAQGKQGKTWRACRHFETYVEEFPSSGRARFARNELRRCKER